MTGAMTRVTVSVLGGSSDAGLAGVEVLGPGDPSGGDGQVSVGGNDGGALSSQLERDGGEVTGRGLHHDAADPCAPREQDVVPLLG